MLRTLLAAVNFIALLGLLMFQMPAFADQDDQVESAVLEGVSLREQGDIGKSIALLTTASNLASSPQIQALAFGELGESLLQANRYEPAERSLHKAYELAGTASRARYAHQLGNLAFIRKNHQEARHFYQEAMAQSEGDTEAQLGIGLNLVRLAPDAEKFAQLAALSTQLGKENQNDRLARLHLNLGDQARKIGQQGLQLAYRHLQKALALSRARGELRPHLESYDSLAQLYEDHQRSSDALELSVQAIALVEPRDLPKVADILIGLEWRQGRLLKASGKTTQALAAYQRATSLLESIRQDMPIENRDGGSSFQQVLEPVLLGYVDLLLQESGRQPPEAQARHLRQAINAIELVKQAELQDYLGERCVVEAIEGRGQRGIPPGTAVFYPLILADRIELLLETSTGIERWINPIDSTRLGNEATWLSDSLRFGFVDFLQPAQQLYDWLLKPIASTLTAQHIHSLIVVPGGALRLVPISALHDGQRFVIEKFAVSMVSGISMTNTDARSAREPNSLLAGIASPGPVVDKLNLSTIQQILSATSLRQGTTQRSIQKRKLRTVNADSLNAPSVTQAASRTASEVLRDALALPGVKQEVEELSRILSSTSMLDSAFTVEKFRREAVTGEYRIVHIASHGVFGGSADSSYIMAYDNILTLDDLQSLLASENLRRNPIDLLSLSACETASGNDRSPLGLSGAAIKARARSVLGTLWPIDDDAARMIMEKFYVGLGRPKATKTEALRQAQLELLRNQEFAHPFYWAPFVLIGNWL